MHSGNSHRPLILGAINLSSRGLHRAIDLAPTLGHGTTHFPCQDISKASEGLALPAQILVTSLDKLNKLAGVDVRIPGRVDIIDNFWWELDAGERGVGGVGLLLRALRLGLGELSVC